MHHKIVHLTSAHPRYDTRIFVKMCSSLVTLGGQTSLIVADGKGNEKIAGIDIIDVGERSGNRLKRMHLMLTSIICMILNSC